jgi:cytochrome b561
MALQEYRVWDKTQRVFHWINALAVITLAGVPVDVADTPDPP